VIKGRDLSVSKSGLRLVVLGSVLIAIVILGVAYLEFRTVDVMTSRGVTDVNVKSEHNRHTTFEIKK
jgi:hypothetical protein